MLFLIVLWWVLTVLAAPNWCYILLAVVMGFKCVELLVELVKIIVDYIDSK